LGARTDGVSSRNIRQYARAHDTLRSKHCKASSPKASSVAGAFWWQVEITGASITLSY